MTSPIDPSPEQAAVRDYPLLPLRVTAGAGTGKTTTIALRLAALVDGGDLEPEQSRLGFGPAGAEDPPHERHPVDAPGPAAERGEVVLAEQRRTRLAQRDPVERRRHPPRRGGEEGIGHLGVEHQVAVGAGAGREAGVEVGADDRHRAHHDLRPELRHQGVPEGGGVDRGRHVDGHDLAPGVDPRIGATGTRGADLGAHDLAQAQAPGHGHRGVFVRQDLRGTVPFLDHLQ